MAWTQQNLDDLEAAIATGARSVTFGDRTVTYSSLDEMMKLRTIMRRSLGLDTTRATSYAVFRKGPRPGFLPGGNKSRTGVE